MRCTVYRSLDKPAAFFGIRGRFTAWFAVILAGVLLLALVAGAMTDTIVGVVAFIAGGGSAYLFVMGLQGKTSDRTFSLRMNSRRYVQYVRVPAGAMRHVWR